MSERNSSKKEMEDSNWKNIEEAREFFMKKIVKSNSILADTSLLREPDWREWNTFALFQER